MAREWYGRYGLEGKERRLERTFEIIPGALCWLIIVGMTVLSLVAPLVASLVMIAFVLYWLLRMLHMSSLLAISYFRFLVEADTDWGQRITDVDHAAEKPKLSGAKGPRGVSMRERLSLIIHRRQLRDLAKCGCLPPASRDICHLVVVPVAKETREIVEPGIAAMVNGSYPSKRILLVVGLEARAAGNVKTDMYKLKEQYGKEFLEFIIAVHPTDVPGEARVKGANANFAARKAAEYFDAGGIPYENVIVSCFDADTVPVKDYFSCLTYYFLITPDRLRTSYQPVPVYFNNIWEVPTFARIVDVGTSFFQLVEATNPNTLVTFSSHSMSFRALVDVGYWFPDIISDDSSIFWKALLHYEGDYRAIPIPIMVSMDIVTGRGMRETFINIYKQKRRWAWGVENFPIVMRGFVHSKRIRLKQKLMFTWRLVDKFTSWATWSFLLSFVSWLPVVFASQEFESTTVYYATPRIKGILFTLALSGTVVCMLISLLLLPRPKTRHRVMEKILHTVEWMLTPFVVLILSALPAIDAQTRLMLGRYMEFHVTDKFRNKPAGRH